MTTLVDLVFKGNFSIINFDFLKFLTSQSKEINFNSPENISVKTFDEIINVFNSNDYIDLIISLNYMNLNKLKIPNVFINIGRDRDEVEVFYFLM